MMFMTEKVWIRFAEQRPIDLFIKCNYPRSKCAVLKLIEARLIAIRKLGEELGYGDLIDQLRPNLELMAKLDDEDPYLRYEHRSVHLLQRNLLWCSATVSLMLWCRRILEHETELLMKSLDELQQILENSPNATAFKRDFPQHRLDGVGNDAAQVAGKAGPPVREQDTPAYPQDRPNHGVVNVKIEHIAIRPNVARIAAKFSRASNSPAAVVPPPSGEPVSDAPAEWCAVRSRCALSARTERRAETAWRRRAGRSLRK